MTERLGTKPVSGRRSRLYIGIGLAVAALIVFLVIREQGGRPDAGASTPATPSVSATRPSPEVVTEKVASLARFDGSANKTTNTFKAASNWQISWEAESGSGFEVELLDRIGASRGEIVTAKKKVKGSTYVSEAGDFKLRVTASGSWKIGIVGRASSK